MCVCTGQRGQLVEQACISGTASRQEQGLGCTVAIQHRAAHQAKCRLKWSSALFTVFCLLPDCWRLTLPHCRRRG